VCSVDIRYFNFLTLGVAMVSLRTISWFRINMSSVNKGPDYIQKLRRESSAD